MSEAVGYEIRFDRRRRLWFVQFDGSFITAAFGSKADGVRWADSMIAAGLTIKPKSSREFPSDQREQMR